MRTGIQLIVIFISLLLIGRPSMAMPVWTEQEKSWINAHPVIPYSFAESWPLDYRKQGKHIGLSRDYLDRLEKNTGLHFVLAAGDAAEAMLHVSLLPAFIPDGESWRYTQRWLTSNTVVITTYDARHIRTLEHLRGKRVAVRAGTWYESWLREYYPDISLLPLPDVRAVFHAVTAGEADVGLGSDLVMRPLLYRSYSHKLVVAAQIPEMVAGLHIGVSQDAPELQAILSKALEAMPASETDQLFTRWVGELKLGYPSIGVIFSIYSLEIGLFLVLVLTLCWALRRALVLKRRAVVSEARKTQFLAMMSHEIRTPMNALIAALELLRLPSSAPQRREYIELASGSSKTLLDLLNDILDHSQLSQQCLRLENSDGITSTGANIQPDIVLPASVLNDATVSARELTGSPSDDTLDSAVKWVYVAQPEHQPNVEVLAAMPAPDKKWKSFAAGMCTMLVISVIAVWSLQYLHRPDPLQTQLAASLAPFPAPLAPEELDILRQQSLSSHTVIAQTQQQLALLDKLPPDWNIDYSRQLVEQAQTLWPEQAKPLMQQWQQQLSAAAMPTEQLNGWHQGMTTLQKLSDRLNGLDEQKGKYMTVSELKSVVFSTMQSFNKSIPAEEQIRALSQNPEREPLPAAARAQLEMHLKQLTARYAVIQENASE